MNVIIVSFPLVFHIINLRECSCISNWALTKSIQTLCCAATQIVHTHTHTHTHTQLSFIYFSSDKYHLHTTQSCAKRASIHCQRLWIPSLSLAAPPLSPSFPTVHRVAYQLPLIYKLSDAAVGADSPPLEERKTPFLYWKKWRPALSRCTQRQRSAVFMERAWSASETWCLLWFWWGLSYLQQHCWSDQTAPNKKRAAISSQHLRLCRASTESLVSLSQAPPFGNIFS